MLQVHYYVECCLVQKMDRGETVRALQAVGVTPCFTELGAAVQPPSQISCCFAGTGACHTSLRFRCHTEPATLGCPVETCS